MDQNANKKRLKVQNQAFFWAILSFVIVLEIFAWWYCPVTAIFGVLIVIFAYFQTRKYKWTVKPAIGYGVLGILGWAFALGALEVFWFQNLSVTYNLFYWFSDPVPYWLFIVFSGFFIVLLISRSLPFSLIATVFYLATEDCAFFIWHGTPPQNWFVYFTDYFPQWLIALGDPIPFWPYIPIFYLLIWAITIPLIAVVWYKNKNSHKNFY